MRVSDVKKLLSNIEVKKDAEFDLLGMATTVYSEEKVLTFLSDIKYIKAILENRNINAIITTDEIVKNYEITNRFGIILSIEPKKTFYELHNILVDREFYWRNHENKLAKSAIISKDSIIGGHSIEIGENSIIEPGVIIHPGTIIKNNVIIRSGSQIGTNGFQFLEKGSVVLPVKTGGRVIIEDNVEIQHNCCIDRGVLGGNTVLKEYVKLDNFVHVAHDDIIGERTLITAGVKLAGRVIIGTDCWLGVNSTVTNGIMIGNNCKTTLGSVVTKSVPDNSTVSGNFAIDHKRFIEFIKSIR